MASTTSRPRLEVPRRLRALMRARETSLVLLGALVGAASGIVVAAMGTAVNLLHAALYGLPPGLRLSALDALDWRVALAAPALGGLGFGIFLWAAERARPRREIDPIEANALHGGRMSLRGSLLVALQTVWSSGVGASVGLEAGYTQLAGGLGSWLGTSFSLRRADLRMLVGCGAAGGIAGAFGAPLAGAFYAFELVIGAYAVASLAPVATAALLGYLVAHALAPASLGITAPYVAGISLEDMMLAALLGLAAAGYGIGLMHAVTLAERGFTRLGVPGAVRPAIGGLLVGAMAVAAPQVLSSGHGALHLAGALQAPIQMLALVFVLKALASAISLGAGFRGGLFFASLLLGAIGGRLYANGLAALPLGVAPDASIYAFVGLAALAVSVIGGPLTMTFLTLEATGDFRLTTVVLVAVIVSAVVTRETFGYSFATWRFHLRGETIRSAADVGWLRELTVGRMMRKEVRTAPARLSIAAFRNLFPLGSASRVALLDGEGRYAGLINVPEAYATELDPDAPIATIAHHRHAFLLPDMTVKEAAQVFDAAEAEALVVVEEGAVLGMLTEAHALRRYAEVSELRRQELLGER